MKRGQNKNFKGKSQITIYGCVLFYWTEFMMPVKKSDFYISIKSWWEGDS